jgi:FkbM family methyltransferase
VLEEEMIVEAIKWGFRKVGLDVHKLYQPPENRFKWLQEFNIKTIIDVGANRGQFAFAIQPFFPLANVYCFEPQMEVAFKLCKEIQSRKLFGCMSVFPFALGDFNGRANMNAAKNTTDTSMLDMTEYFSEIYKKPRLAPGFSTKVCRLDDVVIPVVPELMIKLDVEGYEMNVINGAGRTIDKAKIIYSEVTFHKERYVGQYIFDKFYNIIRSKGFECLGFSQVYYHYRSGAPYYADAVFVRK